MNAGPIPPDPSGADGSLKVVLYTGNTYLMASTDGGATFSEHDTSTFLPVAQGRPVDQVMIYVPHRRLFAWMMQHGSAAGSGDGTFRLAVATASDLVRDVERAWTVYDFSSSDLGLPGVATDRQDLAFSESRLYMTTNLSGKGRVVLTLDLEDLAQKRAVSWAYTNPLDGIFQFSDLSQQNASDVHSVAIVDSSTLRVMALDDGSGTYGFHDVGVAQFPRATDLVSKDPDGVDWLTRGVANVSASVVQGGDLWVAWDAAASAAGDRPFYPNAHVRLAPHRSRHLEGRRGAPGVEPGLRVRVRLPRGGAEGRSRLRRCGRRLERLSELVLRHPRRLRRVLPRQLVGDSGRRLRSHAGATT